MLERPPDIPFCAAGLALCILGWTLYWGGLHALGAAAGLAVGGAAGWFAAQAGELRSHTLIVAAAGAALGAVAGVFLFRRLHFGLLALVGAILGAVAALRGNSLVGQAARAPWACGEGFAALAAAAGAALGAVAFILLHRHIIILATSAAGALFLGQGLPLKNPFLVPAVAFVLAVLFQGGVVHRLGLTRQRREHSEEEDAAE